LKDNIRSSSEYQIDHWTCQSKSCWVCFWLC